MKDFGSHKRVIYYVKEFGLCCLEMRLKGLKLGCGITEC